MNSTEHGPLADTMWRLTELMPWFTTADGGNSARSSQPVGLLALRHLQDEQQSAIEAHLAMTRSAVDHASQSASRLATARSPMDAIVAQAGFGLALAELAAAPARAWLEVIPRLHACCMTVAGEPPTNAAQPSEAEAESSTARTRTRTAATRASEPT